MTSNALRDISQSTRPAAIDQGKGHRVLALHGASLAFSIAPPTSRPRPSTYSGTNGALAAAAAAGLGRKNHEHSLNKGSSAYGSANISVPVQSPQDLGPGRGLDFARESSNVGKHSPSYAAAMLATSRASTPKSTPHQDFAPSSKSVSRRPSPLDDSRRKLDASTSSPAVDETPSKATASLVGLFESNNALNASVPVTQSVRYYSKHAQVIASPTPTRPSKTPKILPSVPQDTNSIRSAGHTNGVVEMAIEHSHAGAVAAAAKLAGAPRGVTATSKQTASVLHHVHEPPAQQWTYRRGLVNGSVLGERNLEREKLQCTRSVSSTQISEGPAISRSLNSLGRSPVKVAPMGLLPDSQEMDREETEIFVNDATATLSKPATESPYLPRIPARRSDHTVRQPSNPPSRPTMQSTPSSDDPIINTDTVRPVRTITRSSESYIPQLTVDSLANAMVASSIASSRAPSPSRPPPLPPPRRHGKSYSLLHHHHHHHHSQEQISRTPSPAKPMRLTMREPVKSEDEVEHKKKRGNIVRKHPNKHHEGDRKRYRNQVTEWQRKRYEGVWAANKGIFLDPESAHSVCNVVVRDIWGRSRLPSDVLEEIWGLVDTQGVGILDREEFVVGMFLIDSRLKGNKLPFKVSDSLWSSVRRLTGIKVPQKRH